jgi:hypothetical protein
MSKKKVDVNTESKDGYLKPTARFKMPKGLRPLIGSISNKAMRDVFKANMIQAVLQSEIKPVKEKKTASGVVELAV